MTEVKMNGTRRAFFLRGGAVLGAGVGTMAAAGALLPGTSPRGCGPGAGAAAGS